MYNGERYNSSNNKQLEVAYKQICTFFLKCKRDGSTNQIIQLNVDPYDVIVRKLWGFCSQRVKFSDNIHLQTITTAVYFTVHC